MKKHFRNPTLFKLFTSIIVKASIMRTSYLCIFPILLFLLSSCKDNQEEVQPINDLLLNCWIDSYEENITLDNQLYRPCDFKIFEPSRFRFSFELKENNICVYLALSIVDAHILVDGTWELNDTKNEVTIFNMDGDIHGKFDIVQIEKDKLKINFK